jgi:hypothetical protein
VNRVHGLGKGEQDHDLEIRVKGHLDPGWSEWFDGSEITDLENGDAVLSGDIVDPASCEFRQSLISLATR